MADHGMMILNTFTQITSGWNAICTTLVLLALVCLLVGYAFMNKHEVLCIGLMIAAVLLFGTNVVIRFSPNCKETRYQVIFDETMSANEVYENYDVLNITGKIWTIREK